MSKAIKALTAFSIILIVAGAALLIARPFLSGDKRVFSVEELDSMCTETVTYRSINNFGTIEETEFAGVPLYELLEKSGVEDGGDAHVKVIAPDGYFWPAVGDRLTLEELRTESPDGLYTLIAVEMNGQALDPEPRGTGPVRFVMPQEDTEHVNKPSWVQNVRLIEVNPIPEGTAQADAAEVPLDEVWLYGNISPEYPYPLWPGILLAALGSVMLVVFLLFPYFRKRVGKGGGAAGVVLLLTVALLCVTLSGALNARAEPVTPEGLTGAGSFTFTRAELEAMPSFSGHYTFLKSQPPYTYYEEDYKGVELSYLLEQRLNLVAGASSVKVTARDGYYKTISLDQVRATYPNGLKVIVAYEKGAGEMLTGDEGPFRLIVPQSNPGKIDQGGDPNTPLCVRMVNSVEVSPIPAGESAPSSIPGGSLAVFGSVKESPQPQPSPEPDPQPSPQPETQPGQQSGTEGQEEKEITVTMEGPSPDAQTLTTVSLRLVVLWTVSSLFRLSGLGALNFPLDIVLW